MWPTVRSGTPWLMKLSISHRKCRYFVSIQAQIFGPEIRNWFLGAELGLQPSGKNKKMFWKWHAREVRELHDQSRFPLLIKNADSLCLFKHKSLVPTSNSNGFRVKPYRSHSNANSIISIEQPNFRYECWEILEKRLGTKQKKSQIGIRNINHMRNYTGWVNVN